MRDPGDTALGGAEGAAKTLRQKGPVLDEAPESITHRRGNLPRQGGESFRLVTEAQTLPAKLQGPVSLCVFMGP